VSAIRLEIEHLTKQFGGVTAVDDVSLTHDQGGVLGLIGPNGAGKTTLFNMLSGAVVPTSGTVRLDGREVTGLRPDRMSRAGVARTFQNLQVFESLTVLENVQVARQPMVRHGLARALVGRDRAHQRPHRQVALELLEATGVADQADELVGNLPYGLQRRVEIARALAGEPRLLLLDEPLAGLSRAESADLTLLMREVADRGVTVLLVEHDVAAVMEVSDRVVVLNLGALLADGTATQVRNDQHVRAAYLGEDT
jgi:ABC-type branched-subunit amino acid transport system ATPase component